MSASSKCCGKPWRTAGLALMVWGATSTSTTTTTTTGDDVLGRNVIVLSVAAAAAASSSSSSSSSSVPAWNGGDSTEMPPPPPPPPPATTSFYKNDYENSHGYYNGPDGQAWPESTPFSEDWYTKQEEYPRQEQEEQEEENDWMKGPSLQQQQQPLPPSERRRGDWRGQQEETSAETGSRQRRWFFGGKSPPKKSSNDGNNNNDRRMPPSSPLAGAQRSGEGGSGGGGGGGGRRSMQRRPPIHYRFPQSEEFAQLQQGENGQQDEELERLPKYATARNDAVTRYISNHRLGRFHICFMSTVFGYYLGSFIAKSVGWGPSDNGSIWETYGNYLKTTFATLFGLWTFLRNDYGEMSRAIGLSMIFLLGTVRSIRRSYPSLRHLASVMGAAPRRPFPPPPPARESPSSLSPDQAQALAHFYRRGAADPSFAPRAVVLAMMLVGGVCGSECLAQIPLVPPWMGALVGALILASATALTRDSALGDLLRCMGMRLVCAVQQVLALNGQLQVLSKAGVVGGHLLDRAMILDRQHRIRQRLGQLLQFLYNKVVQIVTQLRLSTSVADDDDEDEDGGGGEENNWRATKNRRARQGGGGGGFQEGQRYNSGGGNFDFPGPRR